MTSGEQIAVGALFFMPDRRLVTKFCAALAQGRRSRWAWTKSRSCRFPAKLLWPTCRTSLPTRVCAVKPAHGKDAANILRVFCFALSLYRKRTQNDRNIKIFYYCHEGFSMIFHVFIHKNYACPISLHWRTWRAENCGGSLRYCTPRMASVVILYCSVTRANHSPEPSSVPARSTSVSS